MKFSSLRFIMGLLMAVPTVYAAEEVAVANTVAVPKSTLFMGGDQEPVKFTLPGLLTAVAEGNEKAKILDGIFNDLPYAKPAMQKFFPHGEITLHGITVADLRYVEGEEGFPSTLFEKIRNPLNDKEFGISVVPDGRITIYDYFIGQLKTASEHDERAKNLNSVLQGTGVAQLLSEETGYQYCIPPEILVGQDLDIGMEDQKLLKFKNFFGLGLEETKKGKFLKETHPDMQFTSKEQMNKFFQKTIREILKENIENKARVIKNEENIKDLGSELEASKASEEELKAQQVKNEEAIAQHLQEKQSLTGRVGELTASEEELKVKIAQHLQEKQSLTGRVEELTASEEELKKKLAEQLQEKEALALSLKTTQEKAAEFISGVSNLAEQFSIVLK